MEYIKGYEKSKNNKAKKLELFLKKLEDGKRLGKRSK